MLFFLEFLVVALPPIFLPCSTNKIEASENLLCDKVAKAIKPNAMKASIKKILKKVLYKLPTSSLYPHAYQRHLDLGGPVLDGESTNFLIAKLLSDTKGCMVARFGSIELKAMMAIERLAESSSFGDRIFEFCMARTTNKLKSKYITKFLNSNSNIQCRVWGDRNRGLEGR